jgi:hypothetical protein
MIAEVSQRHVVTGDGVGHLLAAAIGIRGAQIRADQTRLVEGVHRQAVRIRHPAQPHDGGDRQQDLRDTDVEERERHALVVEA